MAGAAIVFVTVVAPVAVAVVVIAAAIAPAVVVANLVADMLLEPRDAVFDVAQFLIVQPVAAAVVEAPLEVARFRSEGR